MSEFSDLWKGTKWHVSDMGKKFREDPERGFLGITTPFEGAVWGKALGKNYEPATDMWGAPTERQNQAATAQGINTAPNEKGHTAAKVIASMIGAGYAAGAMGGGGVGAGGAEGAGAGAGAYGGFDSAAVAGGSGYGSSGFAMPAAQAQAPGSVAATQGGGMGSGLASGGGSAGGWQQFAGKGMGMMGQQQRQPYQPTWGTPDDDEEQRLLLARILAERQRAY